MNLDRAQPPACGAVRPFEFPAAQRSRLASGLDVIVAPYGELPVVTAGLILDAGAERDPAGQAGLAHLTAAALETGTATLDAADLAWKLEQLGIDLHIEAGWDAAAARITVPAHRLEPAAALFADILRRPSFPESEIRRLRDEQLADLLQRRKEPRALANDMAARFIFGRDGVYARPLIGTAAEVEEIERGAAVAFHRSYYVPAGAALLLVGAVDAAAAERLAARHFADWSGTKPQGAEFAVRSPVEKTAVFVVDRPGAVQSEIRIGQVGLPRSHRDYFAVLVMNTLLGGAFTSRLNMSLRERHGFTYGARSSFGFRRRPGPFLVQVAVATDVTAAAVREALREIAELRDSGPTDQEVADARDYLAGVMPLQLQTTDQLAARFADIVVYDLPLDYFGTYGARILAVRADDVRRVAREHLRPDRFAIIVVGDAGSIHDPLIQLGVGPVEVHGAD
ncbi:MAG: M16 family metallopeptidase [Longimicrobiales bacterium]